MPNSIAVLILNYNGKVHLGVCLSSVLDQIEPNDEVYLVDNGSIDGSVQYVEEQYPEVKVIKFETNLGFALAYNKAVALVPQEIVLFLNNDVEVDRDWLAQLRMALQRSPGGIAICGSKILLYDNRHIVNHAGGVLTVIGGGIDLDFMKNDEETAREAQFAGCVSGASMIVSRQVFLALGGFDPDFFAYFEDVDLCWRAWLAGYMVQFIPSSRVYHKLSSTMGPHLTPERIFLGQKNRLQAMVKNLELWNALVGLFASGIYTTIRLTRLLCVGKHTAALAILRGDWWFLLHLRSIITKRAQIQQGRKISDDFLLERGLMVRLVHGVKEFARLNRLRGA